MAGLHSLCTVITTTSPTPSNPSTELIDATLQSLCHHAPELGECRNIIVCDGYRVGASPKYRSGVVTEEGATLYEEYISSLQQRIEDAAVEGGLLAAPAWFRRAELLRLDTRHGFGFAVRAALERVATPFVLVVQHDRSFMRRFSHAPHLLAAMQRDNRLKMVGLPTTTNDPAKYVRAAEAKLRGMNVQHPPFESLIVEPPECPAGVRLLPLLMWHDSTHLASTDYYRDFVFGPRGLVSRGGFIEDKLGQQQGHDLRDVGWSSHAEYGTWLLDDGAPPPTRMVGHLNGKRFLDRAEREDLEAQERAAAAVASVGGEDVRRFAPRGGRRTKMAPGDQDSGEDTAELGSLWENGASDGSGP